MNIVSVEGGTGWYLLVLGQNRAVLVANVICFQKINGLHGVNHQFIQYSEKEKVITDKWRERQTDRQTDRQNFLSKTEQTDRQTDRQKGSSKKGKWQLP